MVFGETAVGRGIELPMHGAAFFEAASEEVLAATARAGCCGRTTSPMPSSRGSIQVAQLPSTYSPVVLAES